MQYPIFYPYLLFSIISFGIKLFEIKYSREICILSLEYFNIMANNTREMTYLCKKSFCLNKIYCNNYIFFPLQDIVNKVTIQFRIEKYSPLNLHNTHQFMKKMLGTRVSAVAGH